MAYLRAPIVLAVSFAVTVPDVALARRGEAPVVAQPAAPAPAPAAAPVEAAPAPAQPASVVVVTPAPASAPAPMPSTWDDTAPAASAPAPAPVVPRASAPAPAQRAAPWVPSNAKANALLGSGLGIFGGFYFFTSLAGATIIDKARDGKYDENTGTRSGPDKRRMAYGRGLLIPVVGPFISLAYTDSARERWAASLTGLAQATGAVLTIAGIVAKLRVRRARNVGFAINGAGLSVSGRF
jgi:hypothetical protein